MFNLAPEPPTQPKAGYVYVTNLQFTKSVYNVPTETVELEKEYLFPLVKSIEIERFKHNYSGIIVPFPYKKTSSKRPLDRMELQGTKLLDYFCKYKEVIRKQTDYYQKIRGSDAGEFYGLARVGPYSFAECYVAFRDSTKWRAVVISSVETGWGGDAKDLFFRIMQHQSVKIQKAIL